MDGAEYSPAAGRNYQSIRKTTKRVVSQIWMEFALAAVELDVRAYEIGRNVGQHRFSGEAPEIG